MSHKLTLIKPVTDSPSGNGANAEEKQVALQMADDFIDQMKYPRMKTQVCPTKHTLGHLPASGGSV